MHLSSLILLAGLAVAAGYHDLLPRDLDPNVPHPFLAIPMDQAQPSGGQKALFGLIRRQKVCLDAGYAMCRK
jgi:hypothetical protein